MCVNSNYNRSKIKIKHTVSGIVLIHVHVHACLSSKKPACTRNLCERMHTDQYVSLTALPLESFLFDCISLDVFQVGLQILCYNGSKQNNLKKPFNLILNTAVSFNTKEIPMIVTNQ